MAFKNKNKRKDGLRRLLLLLMSLELFPLTMAQYSKQKIGWDLQGHTRDFEDLS